MNTRESTPTPTQPSAAPPVPVKAAKPVRASTPSTATPKKVVRVRKAPVKVAAKRALAVSNAVPLKPAAATLPSGEKNAKSKKSKLVRDSFTIPKEEYAAIETLKQRAATLAHPIKKSELLRAGLKVLAGMSDATLRKSLQAVPPLKTGRPKTEPTAPPANVKNTLTPPRKK